MLVDTHRENNDTGVLNSEMKLDLIRGASGEQTIFNLNYTPKGLDLSSHLRGRLLKNPVGEISRINKLSKEFLEGEGIVVLANLPLYLKLSEKVLEIIALYGTNPQLAQERHYKELTMEVATSLGSLVRQFPEDLKLIQNILKIAGKLTHPIRQRVDMSGRGYGSQIYISNK